LRGFPHDDSAHVPPHTVSAHLPRALASLRAPFAGGRPTHLLVGLMAYAQAVGRSVKGLMALVEKAPSVLVKNNNVLLVDAFNHVVAGPQLFF